MPRYVVERDFGPISDEQMQEVAASFRVAERHFPDIQWEHTHVCHDADGSIKSFCVYTAPSAARLYEHAETIGATHRVHDLVGDIDPDQIAR